VIFLIRIYACSSASLLAATNQSYGNELYKNTDLAGSISTVDSHTELFSLITVSFTFDDLPIEAADIENGATLTVM